MIPNARSRQKPPSALKTFSHFAGTRRIPSAYELLTSKLLYYPERGGFEVETPLAEWYAKYQRGSPLQCEDWDAFVDPRKMTYASYTSVQRVREAYVDGILEHIEETRYDEQLSTTSRALLERTLPVLRFPFHGLQMIASYVGQLAPSSRIAIAATFQAGDEIRRIQRIAYRMAQLRLVQPGFGDASREAWQSDPAWQPLRETIEHALVAYDWGEALIALNLCLSPVLDDLFMARLPAVAAASGDHLFGAITGSLMQDCAWHREWTCALCTMAILQQPRNRDVMARWVREWSPRVLRAVEAITPLLGEADRATLLGELRAAQAESLRSFGLEVL